MDKERKEQLLKEFESLIEGPIDDDEIFIWIVNKIEEAEKNACQEMGVVVNKVMESDKEIIKKILESHYQELKSNEEDDIDDDYVWV